MDSDDEYDNKRRGSQSRNKFRKERDDYQTMLSSSSFTNEQKRNGSHQKQDSKFNRRSNFENYDNYQPPISSNIRSRYPGQQQGPTHLQSRYESSRTPPPPSNRYMNQRQPPSNGYYPPDDYSQGPGYNMGYKRSFAGQGGPNVPYNDSMPPKRSKREWSSFDSNNPPGQGYYEHDNRLGVDYDEYGDEYNDDYNSLNRPINYSNYSSSSNGFNPMMMNQMLNLTQSMAPIMSQYFNQMNPSKMSNNNNNLNNNLNLAPPMMNPMLKQTLQQQQTNQQNEFPTQPRMMTFKEYLKTLTPEEIKSKPESYRLNKYNTYKEEFRAEQTLEFFQKHKLEDWFRLRYHPEESSKRKQEQRESIKNRLNIFMSLLKRFDDGKILSLDMSTKFNQRYLAKFLDAVMIRLEGGLEGSDLDILEEIYKDLNKKEVTIGEENSLNNQNGEEDKEGKEDAEKKLNNEESEQEKSVIASKNGSNDEKKNDTEDSLIKDLKIPQRTQSIFFKHLPVYVTRQDLERIGRKYDGFKRASISEPAPERGFQRRGWITYDSVCNIKDICSKLNGTRINENNKFQLNATINRDLDQKIKHISGLSNHLKIVRNDLKLCIKVVQSMDKKWGLYEHESAYLNDEKENSNGENNDQTNDDLNKNPLLSKANDYVNEFEESSESQKEEGLQNEQIKMEKDEKASNLLDILILYLRIVHSIDYYNASEYQQEDYMPYRCGVLHVRGSSLVKSDSNTVHVINGSQINNYDPNSIKKSQINEWLRLFENHIRPYSEYRDQIDLDLAKKLGLKDHKEELEKFIKKNCQKIDKDVWLCPLSGKKFKGPDYVKKHIETKQTDKLDELKLDVEYFNKFVLDPKRPYLPEHPMNRNMGKINQMIDEFDDFTTGGPFMMMNQGYGPSPGYFYNNGNGLAGPMPTSHMYNQYGGSGGFYPQPMHQNSSNSRLGHQYQQNNRLPSRR